MLFHSLDFLFFFLLFYPVYLLVRKTSFMNAWLLLASYVFYGWWSPVYLLLILATTIVDFFVVHRIERSPRRRAWLAVSLISNLGVLIVFKYTAFFTQNANGLLEHLGLPLRLPVPSLILPLGISFFTFQSLSYVLDVYRGAFPAERNFVRYAAYVSFFPQMIAGPICRAGSLIPQLAKPPAVTLRDLCHGMSLFLIGLAKKVALADYLAMYVDRVFHTPASQPGSALFLASFAFSWQIYFDFSGYTDMARGVARSMGIELSQNFDTPYIATGLGDFWRRWNISVSTWFRDYVYIPLGGNRHGRTRTAVNVFLTMLTSGFWHGASWNFILWGAIHGAGRVATKELRPALWLKARLPVPARQAIVFLFVTMAWIFFRVQNMEEAGMIVLRIFTSPWGDPGMPILMLGMILSVWLYEIVVTSGWPARRVLEAAPVRVALAALILSYLLLVSQPSTQTFIYFQF
jgi:D-alanyl-lipoteichoic acid acyltransferase DltB (MBOAT superfamily)